MNTFDVNAIAEQVLCKLGSEKQLSSEHLSAIKRIGIGPALKHFASIGSTIVNNGMLRGFLEKQHEAYTDSKKPAWRWQLLRRGTEMLMYFAETGSVDMPPLPKWDRRNCLLYIVPTVEQLANNDNIYGLVWRTRNALKSIGYKELTIRYYDGSGFAKILNAHSDAGTETYSRKLCAQLLLDARNAIRDGKYHKMQALRKAAALLDEFHRYGSITPSHLSSFEATSLCPQFEALVEEYAVDALFSGKLKEVTAATAKSILKGFLLELEKAGFTSFKEVSLKTVSRVIAQTASNHYKCGSSSLLHYVRDFFKYLYEYRVTSDDLSVAVPKIAAPFKRVYQGFTADEIRQLLAAVDRNTSIGKRDYAMMTLAAQTGLRGVDVVKLKRSDIDWHRREIHITQSKTGEPLCITLETESGNAICDYILNARQKCDLPHVFLRAPYPLGPLGPYATMEIVSKYMKLAGIVPTARQRYGFHSFRRAFGTRLLESGTPVYLLSQLLGHIDLDSAVPYMSASEQRLKECCLPLDLGENVRGAI